jgi:hypothetical protein
MLESPTAFLDVWTLTSVLRVTKLVVHMPLVEILLGLMSVSALTVSRETPTLVVNLKVCTRRHV